MKIVKIAGVVADIKTKRVLNTDLERYFKTNLFGPVGQTICGLL
jgi:hypothetical protein